MRRLLLLLPLCLLLAPETPAPPTPPPPVPVAAPPTDAGRMEALARDDPVGFLRACVERYDREVTGYRALLIKQERLGGVVQPEEHMRAWFRERPSFRVLMEWTKGARLAHRTLYVKGENGDQLLVKPTGILGIGGTARRDPHGADAKASARYPATEFGIQVGTRRTLTNWKALDERGELRVTFDGLQTAPELGYPCWRLVRTSDRPDADGIVTSTYYFDPATWLQVGSDLRDADGGIVGRYFFTDLQLNAEIPDSVFTEKELWR